MIPGIVRYSLKLKDLAREPRKSPDGMTKAITRAARRRTEDDGLRVDINELYRRLAGAEE